MDAKAHLTAELLFITHLAPGIDFVYNFISFNRIHADERKKAESWRFVEFYTKTKRARTQK